MLAARRAHSFSLASVGQGKKLSAYVCVSLRLIRKPSGRETGAFPESPEAIDLDTEELSDTKL